MSAKKTDISKYLKGELDARASHKLEREAQDDPFLMDALEGYENLGKQDANLTDLQGRLTQRVAPKKERSLLLWRVLPIAACVLIALTVGYWYLTPKPVKQQLAIVVQPTNKIQAPATVQQQPLLTENTRPAKPANKLNEGPAVATVPQQSNTIAPAVSANNNVIYHMDTVEYTAGEYKVRPDATVNELLKKMEGTEADSNGSILARTQPIAKARLNGKDFNGGDVQQAIKNLPADIVDKIHVVDDYGDQAPKTGVANGATVKTLRMSKDTTNNNLLVAKNARVLNEVAITRPAYPLIGWVVYSKYLNDNAIMPDGSIGEVELGFKVGIDLSLSNIRVINSRDKAMGDKAIEILKAGSKWMGGDSSKETRLKIMFHKKN